MDMRVQGAQTDASGELPIFDGKPCPVTLQGSTLIGNQYLDVIIGWLDGVLQFRRALPDYPDGARRIKVAWDRKVPGRLTIRGHRLDIDGGAPLRAEVPSGYGDIGGQSSYVIFPTEGCWEVTGSVRGHTLSFVTVVRFPDAAVQP